MTGLCQDWWCGTVTSCYLGLLHQCYLSRTSFGQTDREMLFPCWSAFFCHDPKVKSWLERAWHHFICVFSTFLRYCRTCSSTRPCLSLCVFCGLRFQSSFEINHSRLLRLSFGLKLRGLPCWSLLRAYWASLSKTGSATDWFCLQVSSEGPS